jgi:hypothetical protein
MNMRSPCSWRCARCRAQVLAGNTPDFSVTNHGSILILHALTDAAREWVDEHIGDDAMTWGRNGTVVEPRYIGDIVEGIRAAGLEVSP